MRRCKVGRRAKGRPDQVCSRQGMEEQGDVSVNQNRLRPTSLMRPVLRALTRSTNQTMHTVLRSVELPTADVQAAVQLMGLRQGRGTVIVIASVEPGSAAAAAGVKPGQQLLTVSDPIRREEDWQINGQSSLRYVRQAIRMRVADTISLTLTAQPIPEWRQAAEEARAAERAAADAQTQQAAAQQAEAEQQQAPEPDDLLSNIVRASMDASGSFDEASLGGGSGSGGDAQGVPGVLTPAGAELQRRLTVAEKLEAQYQQQQAEAAAGGGASGAPTQRQLTDLERRKKRREEYFDQACPGSRWGAVHWLGWLGWRAGSPQA